MGTQHVSSAAYCIAGLPMLLTRWLILLQDIRLADLHRRLIEMEEKNFRETKNRNITKELDVARGAIDALLQQVEADYIRGWQ